MEMILMTLHCWFCGSSRERELPAQMKRRVFPGCEDCYIDSKLKAGAKIVYAGYMRNPAGAAYADKLLKRDAVYTVKKITQWQHGCSLTLQETDMHTFDHSLFVPAKFDLSKIVCKYPEGMAPKKEIVL